MESENKTITITNHCYNRIWFRCYNEAEKYEGRDIGPREKITFQTKLIYKCIKGFKWEKGEPEIWNPTFICELDSENGDHNIIITPIFGPRIASSIKVFIACLAGPADPMTRNDITMANKFISSGIPPENVTLLVEKQCTPKTIKIMLKNYVKNLIKKGDILFMYLGGHGINTDQKYQLCTFNGYTDSDLIMKTLGKCKSEVFLTVDSCYSGLMIENVKSNNFSINENLYLLSSTDHDKEAYTRWSLIQMLIDNIFVEGIYSDACQIGNFVKENLKTCKPDQKANFYLKK